MRSGHTFALNYCLNTLFYRDCETAEKLVGKLNYGIKLNYREVALFWKAHENPFEFLFKAFYGNYLKANTSPKG